MYKVTIRRLGKTTEQFFDNLTEANFTIVDAHADARALGFTLGHHYQVKLEEVA